jgi:hypothetical protein
MDIFDAVATIDAERATKPTSSNYPTTRPMTRLPGAGLVERISDGGAI